MIDYTHKHPFRIRPYDDVWCIVTKSNSGHDITVADSLPEEMAEWMCEALNAYMTPAPAWTHTPPTEPGWYWFRNDLDTKPIIIEVDTYEKKLVGKDWAEVLRFRHHDYHSDYSGWITQRGVLFCGPISPPELPESEDEATNNQKPYMIKSERDVIVSELSKATTTAMRESMIRILEDASGKPPESEGVTL